jgi:uncharacterized membrane protein YqhA
MLTKLLGLRYLYVVAVVFTLINSLVLPLLESLDWFLVALVFLVFSLGIAKIFIGYDGSHDALPSWLRIHDFKELKILLWESILVTLVVWCMSAVARSRDALTWEALVLPAIVLVLAVGLYLMRGKEA